MSIWGGRVGKIFSHLLCVCRVTVEKWENTISKEAWANVTNRKRDTQHARMPRRGFEAPRQSFETQSIKRREKILDFPYWLNSFSRPIRYRKVLIFSRSFMFLSVVFGTGKKIFMLPYQTPYLEAGPFPKLWTGACQHCKLDNVIICSMTSNVV